MKKRLKKQEKLLRELAALREQGLSENVNPKTSSLLEKFGDAFLKSIPKILPILLIEGTRSYLRRKK